MPDNLNTTLSEEQKNAVIRLIAENIEEPQNFGHQGNPSEKQKALNFQVVNAAKIKPISPGSDENELLANRFLCRQGILLLAGPTGIGKSSFIMQCALSWGLGQGCFGINPTNELKTLLIQAENDEGDLAEEIAGVLKGMGLSRRKAAEALKRVDIISISTVTGSDVPELIRKAVSRNSGQPYDIVIIDPVFSYLGGDASAQETVSHFLRNTLLPCLIELKIGCILVHHTNKPPRAKDKDMWQGAELAYLGAGSAEWANAARAVLGIKVTPSPAVFELVAPKRGNRLGWQDPQGYPTIKKLIAHSRKPGEIFWREADEDEIISVAQEKANKTVEQKIANLWNNENEEFTRKEFIARAEQRGIKKSSAYEHWKKGPIKGVFTVSKKGKAKLSSKYRPEAIISE